MELNEQELKDMIKTSLQKAFSKNMTSLSGNDSITDNFWGIEYFQGKIYLASLNGLFVLDDGHISTIKTGLTPEIKGYRLHANDGVLWSFGVDDLAFFDGNNWQRVIHPDNV